MAHPFQCSDENPILATLIEHGFDGMSEAIAMLVNEAMRLEREHHLKAKPYERTEARTDYANGFKPRKIQTRIGTLDLSVPQTRSGEFYPNSLEKGLRSERALKQAIAEMYLDGVSTRKVRKISEVLCGFEVTRSQVSRAAQELDEEFEKWRTRSLGKVVYVYLDARYEKVRVDGQVRDSAVLMAVGVNDAGIRSVLGVSVSLSEHEVHWRDFLLSLQQRGLHGVELIISDAHAGLANARTTVFRNIPWQRCQFHMQQNAQAYVPRKSMKEEVAQDIPEIFNASSLEEAKRLLRLKVEKYKDSACKLSEWMEKNIPEGLTIHQFPVAHQKKIRTSNLIERLNREIKRRTKVVSIFPNEASCLRLVTAQLIEKSESWETGTRYLTFDLEIQT